MSDYEIYEAIKTEFFKKHGGDFVLKTSPLDEYNRYSKTYIFEDDAVWYEITDWVNIDSTADIKGVIVDTVSQANRTEYWSSDDSKSKYFYEIFDIKLKRKERSERYATYFSV